MIFPCDEVSDIATTKFNEALAWFWVIKHKQADNQSTSKYALNEFIHDLLPILSRQLSLIQMNVSFHLLLFPKF